MIMTQKIQLKRSSTCVSSSNKISEEFASALGPKFYQLKQTMNQLRKDEKN